MKNLKSSINWRLGSSYITSLISISLVLVMLGIVGVLIINAQYISNSAKEQLKLTVVLNKDAKESEISQLQKDLDLAVYTKTTEFRTEKQEAEELKEELGEDFVNFIGYNPLSSCIKIHLKAEYANLDSISVIENQIKQNSNVSEIIYRQRTVNLVNENVRKISIAILIFTSFIFFIAVVLINNTIRLTIYSKRFTIRTMQLVGATNSFIQYPFLMRGVVLGLTGSLAACVFLIGSLSFIQQQIDDFIIMQNIEYVVISLVLIGTGLTLTSTYFSMKKYLQSDIDQMYY